MSEPAEVVYKFKAKGHYSDGNKATLTGIVVAPDGFPGAAFEKAVSICQELTPGLIVDMNQRGHVVLSKRKTKKA